MTLERLAEFAAKLYQPSDKEVPEGELPFREGEQVNYVEQVHHAKRAGRHIDIRVGDKERGMYSWATRKEIPEPGQKIQGHPQPIHPASYNEWEGEIPSGYGAGTVKSQHVGRALVTHAEPGQTNITVTTKRGSHRLAFIKHGKKHLIVREKLPEAPQGAEKPKFKSVAPGEASSVLDQGGLVQPKIDGALVYVNTKGGRPEILSHRKSKITGKNIVHTERVLGGRPRLDIPKEDQGAVLAELYGEKKGKAINPQELGGLLNAHIDESLRRQKQRGIRLKLAPFDVVGEKGDYGSRLARVQQIAQHLGDVVETPETVPAEHARGLIKQIAAGKHPLTKEGVIVRGKKDVKIKNVAEEDVRIHDVFPGKGKFEGHPGGFTYTDEAGQPVGRVGTGLSDETRKNLRHYIGRIARVRHQGRYPSGALRAPSLIAIHESRDE